MSNEAKGTAPERVWLPAHDSPYNPNAEFYSERENESDIEYVRTELIEQLERWKREAMPLLTRYDDLAETFGGKLA